MNKILAVIALLLVPLLTSACARDAQVASYNLSQKADAFELSRRIIFYNGVTDTYMLVIEGLCSIKKDRADKQLEVTCKTGADKYKKHFLGISDNVTYFAEQLESKTVSVYHYRVYFRPQVIIPDIVTKTDVNELKRAAGVR